MSSKQSSCSGDTLSLLILQTILLAHTYYFQEACWDLFCFQNQESGGLKQLPGGVARLTVGAACLHILCWVTAGLFKLQASSGRLGGQRAALLTTVLAEALADFCLLWREQADIRVPLPKTGLGDSDLPPLVYQVSARTLMRFRHVSLFCCAHF